jgi:hypothetical protein
MYLKVLEFNLTIEYQHPPKLVPLRQKSSALQIRTYVLSSGGLL